MSGSHAARIQRLAAIAATIGAGTILAAASLPGLPAGAATPRTVEAALRTKPAPRLENPEATGRALTTEFLTILQRGDTKELAKFLDPAFQLQRADGTGADRKQYLLEPAIVTDFVIPPGLEVRQHGDVLTVRWNLEVDEVIDGAPAGTGLAPRLSTFRWSGSRWRLVAHANFNLPT